MGPRRKSTKPRRWGMAVSSTNDDDSSRTPQAVRAAPSSSSPSLTDEDGYDASAFPLYKFLYYGVETQGTLLPFLTTTDLLHLSECSKGLAKYRYMLSRVSLTTPPPTAPAVRLGLMQLLSRQQPGLSYLRVGQRDVLTSGMMDELASLGALRHLQTLDLSRLSNRRPHDVACLGGMLEEGYLPRLQDLILGSDYFHDGKDYDLTGVMKALARGACPTLRRLHLEGCDLTSGEAEDWLFQAFESGHLVGLQSWKCPGKFSYGTFRGMMTLLGEGLCPDLRVLATGICVMDRVDVEFIASAMRTGHCSKLERLEVSGDMEDEDMEHGFVAILEALAAGCCPNMEHLDLGGTFMHELGGMAIALALRSGHCRRLRYLDLSWALGEGESSLLVLQALKEGCFPDLRHLSLQQAVMEEEHGQMLGEMILSGQLSRLDTLDFGAEPDWFGDQGAIPVLLALEAGGCPRLHTLELMGCKLGANGGAALANALRARSMPLLQELRMGFNKGVGDKSMAQVLRALGAREAFPQLRLLQVNKTGMGQTAGRALLKALRDNAWPKLDELMMWDNPRLKGVEGLAQVLEAGAGQALRELSLQGTGLTRAGAKQLCEALVRGACPNLHYLKIGEELAGNDSGVPWQSVKARRAGKFFVY